MNILLVEPNYNNKYPPMGLMKISAYHKGRGDYVYFYKGKYDVSNIWDRIYLTTLFTFDYDLVVDTIKFYYDKVESLDDIYVGGIAASILTDKFNKELGIKNIITNRLTNSSMLGYNDNVNIDTLPLDYDILDDIMHEYKAGDNFYGYTTRGCVNKCSFCAVPKIEGDLIYTNNIKEQVNSIRVNFGDKKNLLLLDNNILALEYNELRKIVYDLVELGFIREKTYIKENPFILLINDYIRKSSTGSKVSSTILKLQKYLENLFNKRISKKNREKLEIILDDIYENHSSFIDGALSNYDALCEITHKYYDKKLYPRYIDFNQGMDARELTEEKMQLLSLLPIRPFRLAFDNLSIRVEYERAIRLAVKYGVRHFSNYLLYNFTDHPDKLYERLKINISLANELNVYIYSFPMLFAPVNQTNRKYLGKHWNYHYLKNIRSILNVTKGIVAKEEDFFKKAFGRDAGEFNKILAMPRDFVVYRQYFETVGLAYKWEVEYNNLQQKGKLKELLILLSGDIRASEDQDLDRILQYYRITYKSLKKKEEIQCLVI
ncbi:MAG: hypothetical protein ACLKAL_12020 [Alkaliphilus sp.]